MFTSPSDHNNSRQNTRLVKQAREIKQGHRRSKLKYKFQDQENSKDIFSLGSALEDIFIVIVFDRNIVRLRIPMEEWRGNDASLTHLKAVTQMKCDITFGIQRVTKLSKAEILHLWTRFMKPGGSSDTSEWSKNSGSFKDSGRSNEEDSKDEASSEEGGSKTLHVRMSSREARAP
nr:hypothetical protein [Tanacetum cinerariifolium]